MMRNDVDDILNSLLADWHCWCSNFRHVAQSGSCAMFTDVKSSRQWQDSDDIHDSAKHNSTMKAIEFAINGDDRGQGAMADPYRTALCIAARNIVSGVRVWSSPRLPSCPKQRAVVISEAKVALLKRLFSAGIV